VEIFRRLGGDEVAARDFAELTEESADEFNRVCHPLYSSKPGSWRSPGEDWPAARS
jgi:hypothetical protein